MELPTESDILTLPAWAILAFAARCSRLAVHESFKSSPMDRQFRTLKRARSKNPEQDDRLNRLSRALKEDEDAAAEANAGKAAAVGGTGPSFVKQDGSNLDAVADSVNATVFCGYSVASPVANPFSGKPIRDYSRAAVLATESVNNACRAFQSLVPIICQDFYTLRAIAGREGWTNESPVSPTFFSEDVLIERRIIFAINDLCIRLCEIIAESGKALQYVEWRQLEQVIATALDGLGFTVELTPPSKDGGKDIIAQCVLNGRVQKYFIEVKHWRSGKKVGLRDIADFIEVNVSDKTDGGLYLSTSGYTPSVITQISEINRRRIELGGEVKVINLCQHFVQRKGKAIWTSQDVLPQILFKTPLL